MGNSYHLLNCKVFINTFLYIYRENKFIYIKVSLVCEPSSLNSLLSMYVRMGWVGARREHYLCPPLLPVSKYIHVYLCMCVSSKRPVSLCE